MTPPAQQPSSAPPAAVARRLAVLILVVLASAGVGLGAMSLGLLSVPWGADEEMARTVRFVAAVALLAGLLVLLLQQRNSRSPAEDRRGRGDDPTGSSFLAAAALMGLLLLLVLLLPSANPPGGPGTPGRAAWGDADTPEPELELPPPPESAPLGQPPELVPPELSDEEPDDTPEEADTEPTPPTPAEDEPPRAQPDAGALDGLAGLSLLLLFLVVAGFGALTLRGWLRRRRSVRPPAEDEAEGTRAAASDLNAEPSFDPDTPRGRITLAYRQLLQVLDEAGVPREPWEAPYEHLHRAARELEIHRHAPLRLARLHVAAQFSPHPVTDEDVAEAEAALEESRAGVRQAPGRRRAGAVPAPSGERGR